MREMRRSSADRLISGLLNAVYPSTCPSCSSSTDNLDFAPFCASCWSGILRYTGASCRICSDPFESGASGVCGNCIKDPPPFSRTTSYGIYDRVLAQAIHALKFRRIRRLHKPLGALMLTSGIQGFDIIVPVPLSARGLRERGFNQSLLLAKVISAGTKKPLVVDGLVKRLDTPPQIGLTARERTGNLRGVFSAVRDFSGLEVLLVDDVMTTGATARACSKQLLKAGAKDVSVLTLARASAT